MNKKKIEWGDGTQESKDSRLLAFKTIEESERLKGHGIARWLVKYIFSLEVYGIGEPHPSNEYLCKKYNADNNGHCSLNTMMQEIWWAKKSEFITTTGKGRTRTFELNIRFLTDEMAKVKGLEIKRAQEKERSRAYLLSQLNSVTENPESKSIQKSIPKLTQKSIPKLEGQNNSGDSASKGKGGGKGEGLLLAKANRKSEVLEVVQVVGLDAIEEKGKLRIVDKEGNVVGGNPYTEKAYMLWEEIMGCPLKRNQWNSKAGYNLLRAKDKGEEWFRKMLIVLRECKKDPKADFRAKNIANLSDLQKNWEYLVDWARQKAEKKAEKNSVHL